MTPWVQSRIRPHNTAASIHCMHNLPSPIKYNGLTHTVYAISRQHAYTYIQQIGRKLKSMNAKNTKKLPIHENADANITCDFGDGDISRYRSRFPHTHTASPLARLYLDLIIQHQGCSTQVAVDCRSMIVLLYQRLCATESVVVHERTCM